MKPPELVLKPRAKGDIRRFFESRFRRHGDVPAALDWSPGGQRRRFEVLAEVVDLQGRGALDVGCGLGHFCDFLQSRDLNVQYVGIDLSPKLIARARERRPDVSFQVLDALSHPLPERVDVVFASGVLNVEDGRNEEEMRHLMKVCFDACRVAAAVNMLSTWADWFRSGRHYYDPIRMVRAARRLTRRVVLRHDYMPHDFTLYLYREAKS